MKKQIAAIKLAIETMTKERRKFAAGHVAYIQQKIHPVEIKGSEVTGTVMGFAEDEHKKYMELDNAITQMEDLIEILTDPGVTKSQTSLQVGAND